MNFHWRFFFGIIYTISFVNGIKKVDYQIVQAPCHDFEEDAQENNPSNLEQPNEDISISISTSRWILRVLFSDKHTEAPTEGPCNDFEEDAMENEPNIHTVVPTDGIYHVIEEDMKENQSSNPEKPYKDIHIMVPTDDICHDFEDAKKNEPSNPEEPHEESPEQPEPPKPPGPSLPPGITDISQLIKCQHCQGGPNTNCAQLRGLGGVGWHCPSNQCYEAFIGFQNGAMPIVQRRCWLKSNTTVETDFCEWFNNSEAKKRTNAIVYYCKPCFTSMCNLNKDFWLTSSTENDTVH